MVEQLNLPAGEVAVRANGVNVSENQAPLDHQYSERTMQDLHQDESRPSQVRVAFADGELSFTLSKDATFEDLADQLRDLDERPTANRSQSRSNSPSPDARRRRLLSGLGRGIGTAAPKGGRSIRA
jgi:hypothetical protein